MIHLATALLAIGDSPEARALHQRLLASSYTGPLVRSLEALKAAAARTRPDVIVLGPGLADLTPLDALKAVRAEPSLAEVPVFVLTDRPLAEDADALAAAGADDAATWPAAVGVVVARVRPLVRLATMRGELAHRLALTREAGAPLASPPDLDSAQAPVILVAGAPEAESLVRAALGPDAALTRAPDLFEAQRLMEHQRFDAAVLAAHGEVEPFIDLCLQIRRNSRLFNLPVVFLAPGALMPDPARPLDAGASQALAIPATAAELRFALVSQVRRQRLRWAIREALAATRLPALADSVVREAYSAAALTGYLDRRVEDCLAQERQLSVVGFAFAGVDAIRHEFGEEAEHSLLDQIGQWLSLLVRAEDLVARLDGARFVVTLPDTPLSEAEVVMNRIAGVISNTDFAVRDVYRVVNVWPLIRATALTAGDDVATLLERAAVNLADL